MADRRDPLYQDKQIRVDYAPENRESHQLFIGNGERPLLVFERGCLEKCSLANRDHLPDLIRGATHRGFWEVMEELGKEGLSVDSIHVAICQAYMEERRRPIPMRVCC